MYANSLAWQGVKHKDDVPGLSRERQQWLSAAVRAGAFLIASIGSGAQAKDSEYANHSFHAGIIATARYLLRMVELLPEACDLYQVSLDLDKLLLKLPHCEYDIISSWMPDVWRTRLPSARHANTQTPHTHSRASSDVPSNARTSRASSPLQPSVRKRMRQPSRQLQRRIQRYRPTGCSTSS